MLLIDPATGTIRYANQAAARFYGYPRPSSVRCRSGAGDGLAAPASQVSMSRGVEIQPSCPRTGWSGLKYLRRSVEVGPRYDTGRRAPDAAYS
ncbi:MAG: hypothetical protein HGA45_21890 [Chloroflexales bacterium]|nr:hypothetical protein [Chloroflexales bacterium]